LTLERLPLRLSASESPMKNSKVCNWVTPLIFIAGTTFALATSTARASAIYNVAVDTSSVSGSQGFLDFQFDPGNASSQAATAVIGNFNTVGGTLIPPPSTTGSVVGLLPGTVTFTNNTALNEYFEGFKYGASFSFTLTLSGPALDSPNGTATAGTTFGLGLYDQNQNPILTNQGATTGFAGQVDILLNGSTSATAFPNGTGPSVVTFTRVTNGVPDPGSTVLLLGLAMAGLLPFGRRGEIDFPTALALFPHFGGVARNTMFIVPNTTPYGIIARH
jgi:hypothetical protein